MARNSRTRKANGGSRLTYDVLLMVLGIAVGVVTVVLYQGATSGDPDRMGAGISQLLRSSDIPDPESAPGAVSAGVEAPARASFDFYTVLPEIEHVIPEADLPDPAEDAVAAKDSAETPKDAGTRASFYMLQAASYDNRREAERMKARLAIAGFEPSIQHISVQGQGDFFRVRVGPYPSMATMESANRVLADMKIRALRLKVSRQP
ncbi:MAG: SPOR domain-containing protein [Arenicellales bacterium]|nr:SPOR domain-containing protein [Arenicellales bacterium]